MSTRKKKLVLTLSGGMDSAVLLYMAADQGFNDIHTVTFDYGQRHKRELECVQKQISNFRDKYSKFNYINVTNKVLDGAIKIHKGEQSQLALGNLNATRDWGHAKDYVKAMWMMLQHDKPDDFVCAMGESHSIRDLCTEVFSELDMDYRDYVVIDSKYFRPTELTDLRGDSTKLRTTLGWKPTYTFRSMIEEMVKARL